MSDENKIVELDDDLLELVNGGIVSKPLNGYPNIICSKCKKAFSLGDYSYESLGYAGSVNKFVADHEDKCTG